MAELYLDKYAVHAHIYDMYCDKCNKYTHYDGIEDHYFRPHTSQNCLLYTSDAADDP